MKIRADEHVSIKIVKALRLLCLSSGWELSHVRDDHAPRTADETWIPAFAANGGRAILSGDSQMLKRPHQIMAVQATGLICVVLSSKWAEAKRHEQAASLIFWWPRIELQLKTAQAGDSIPVPHTFSSDDLSIKKINYEAAKIADAKSKR